MRVLVLDMTHGGFLIAARFAAEGDDVTCVDVYRNCPQEHKDSLRDLQIRVCDEVPPGDYDLLVKPKHCPMRFAENSNIKEVMSFSEATGRFLEDGRFRIEITGVKGKTSACYLISKMLHDAGKSVLMHTSRGEGPWEGEGQRIDRRVSIAPPFIMTLAAGDYDAIVCEVSLGGSGKADIACITNLVTDYGIAGNTDRASNAKKDVLTGNINIVPEDEKEFWSQYGKETVGYGIRVRPLEQPRLGKPLKVSVEYKGKTYETELDGGYISIEYLRSMDLALQVCEIMDIPAESVLNSLKTFKGVPGRGELEFRDGMTIVRERNPGISKLSAERTLHCLREMDAIHDAMIVLDPVSRRVCDKMDGAGITAVAEEYGIPIAITDGDGKYPEIPKDVKLLIELIKEAYQ